MLGWTVLNNLKLDPDPPHPVQMLSVEERAAARLVARRVLVPREAGTDRGLEGALDRIKTYADRTLAAARGRGQQIERDSIVELLAHDDIEIQAVGTGGRGMAAATSGASTACVSTCGCRT
jgi:hypothetical protein